MKYGEKRRGARFARPTHRHNRCFIVERKSLGGETTVASGARAIVNAANAQLAAGDGVCGAIFAASDKPKLEAACRQLYSKGTPIGTAAITPAFGDLASKEHVKAIVHAVGPHMSAKVLTDLLALLKVCAGILRVGLSWDRFGTKI